MRLFHIIIFTGFLFLLLRLPFLAEELTLPGDFKKAYIVGNITYKGKPLTDVQIIAYSKDGGHAVAFNAANGNYALGAGEGKWTVFATKKDYLSPKAIEVFLTAEETKKVNIEMQKSAAFIEGIVVDEANKPIPKALVMAMPNMFNAEENADNADEAPETLLPSDFHHTICDNKGNFHLQTIKGSYIVMASAPGYEMSPKNPAPKIPGMEDIPEEYKKMIPPMAVIGINVAVAEGETKKGVVIILRLKPRVSEKSVYEKPASAIKEKPEVILPMPNVIVGKSELSPNNILHWTRTKKNEDLPFYMIARSTKDFSAKEKGEIKLFQFPAYIYGEPKQDYYSFTDNTAVPGKNYWYAVYEMGTSGAGPYSNSVIVKTK